MDTPTAKASDTDIAWAAGLFEGEGSVCASKSKGRIARGLRMQLGMSDQDVVERFFGIVGHGAVYPAKPYKTGWKPRFTWTSNRSKQCIETMETFLPYLGERRTSRWYEVKAIYDETRLTEKECPECAGTFMPHWHKQVCCSNACSKKRIQRDGPYAGFQVKRGTA
jgi:hypothetical protein